MGKVGTLEQNPGAGPASVRIDELSYDDLLTGSRRHINPRVLDSLPWKKINEFLASVGAERSIEGLAHRMLREIGTLLPSDYGVFTIITPGALISQQQPVVVELSAPRGAVSEYFSHYIAVDPCLPRYLSTHIGVVSWLLRDCEFTRDFARRFHSLHTMQIGNLKGGADAGFLLSLHRKTRLGFDEKEMAACSAVRLHLHNLFSLLLAPEKARRSRLSAAASACGLTQREADVVLFLCDRLSAGEIAEHLTISRRTVEKHIEHVYLKLGVHGRRWLHEEMILATAFPGAPGSRRASGGHDE